MGQCTHWLIGILQCHRVMDSDLGNVALPFSSTSSSETAASRLIFLTVKFQHSGEFQLRTWSLWRLALSFRSVPTAVVFQFLAVTEESPRNIELLPKHWGFPGGSVVKNLPTNAGAVGDTRSISGGGNGNPLQYSCLGNPMGRGAWRATVHGVEKSQTRPSDWACIHHPATLLGGEMCNGHHFTCSSFPVTGKCELFFPSLECS